MNVIDKILNEWSFRCHDGIVDMKDPIKLSVLKEIMIEEGIDDDIVDAILSLPEDDPKKQKVLAYLQGNEDEKEKEIERLKQQIDGSKQEKERKTNKIKEIIKTLTDKNLSKSTAYLIVFEFVNNDKEDDLISYFDNPPKLEVKDGIDIKAAPLNKLPEDSARILDNLYDDLSGAGGTKGIGKEENFLVAFYENIKKLEGKGDIEVDGQKYEVKGVSSMVTPSSVSRGSKKNVVDLLANSFLNQLEQPISLEKFKEKERWITTISKLYTEYPDKKEFIDKLQPVLNQKYPSLVINDKILKNSDEFSKEIAKNLITRFDISEDEKILFISPEGKMKVYNNKSNLMSAIDKGIIAISSFSDFVPRLTLPKEKEKIKIGIANFEENVKDNKVSRNWYNGQEKEKQKYFDETKSIKNFIPLKPEYQNTVELVPYASLEEELTNHLIKSFK
jgi:hypothetical protein